MAKLCLKCGKTRELTDFSFCVTNKDGVRTECKKCIKKRNKRYRRTKNGVISTIYNGQKIRSRKRKWRPPSYTNEELGNWLLNQSLFHQLYSAWKNSNYNSEVKPSCDRIDDYKPYALDNLQLMTWKQNHTKSCLDRRNGNNNKTNKAVVQLTLKRQKIVDEYCSIREAERVTGIANQNIYSCCVQHYTHAGGYIWKYKKERDINGMSLA